MRRPATTWKPRDAHAEGLPAQTTRGPGRTRQRGMAIPAVLALLVAVAMLLLAHAALVATNWLAARNLREGLHAWARAESAATAAVAELAEAHRRHGALPDAYALADAAAMDVQVTYAKRSADRADLDVLAAFRNAAVRRRLEVDMTP